LCLQIEVNLSLLCVVPVLQACMFQQQWYSPIKNCHESCSEAPVRTRPLTSDTGCMNTELFMQWLQDFQNHLKATSWPIGTCFR
jgi:hypothetical protein